MNQNLFYKMRHKILRDFDIKTDHLIQARRPDLESTNNNNSDKRKEIAISRILLFQRTTERKWKEAKNYAKSWIFSENSKSYAGDTNCSWGTWKRPQMKLKELKIIGNE